MIKIPGQGFLISAQFSDNIIIEHISAKIISILSRLWIVVAVLRILILRGENKNRLGPLRWVGTHRISGDEGAGVNGLT